MNNFRYFKNEKCKYYPCHKVNGEYFNCIFCFCPLYFLGESCGGNFRMLPNGKKDCSGCTLVHSEDGYDYVIKRLSEQKCNGGLRRVSNILVVVDMQNDFISGSLGSEYAEAIVENVVNKINSFDGEILVTYDTHSEDYMSTGEGKKLPVPHCIKGTDGWRLDSRVQTALDAKAYTTVEKITFGSVDLPRIIGDRYCADNLKIELIGLCTDICVVSNALILKAHYPEAEITVDSDCCAGVTPQTHSAALETMKCCQINVI